MRGIEPERAVCFGLAGSGLRVGERTWRVCCTTIISTNAPVLSSHCAICDRFQILLNPMFISIPSNIINKRTKVPEQTSYLRLLIQQIQRQSSGCSDPSVEFLHHQAKKMIRREMFSRRDRSPIDERKEGERKGERKFG